MYIRWCGAVEGCGWIPGVKAWQYMDYAAADPRNLGRGNRRGRRAERDRRCL